VVYGELGSVGTYGFGSEAGRLHAIHTVNGPIAGYPHDAGSAVRGSPALDVQSTAYVVTADGLVRAVGYDGRTRWVYDTGAANVASQSPVLACDGTLYVGTGNGKVVALSADGAGLVNTTWPRFQHDNRNTGNTSTALRVAGACVD
jgi:outer membrane protein assembly factor BamB